MNDIEAIGELAQGGLIARAVEPAAGESGRSRDGHTHERACLNCGTELIGSHCHSCGQKAHVHRTIGAFLHDLVHGALHFEGKIWHTLPLLAWRPGALTRRYIDGERARFVSPMALFLFSIFLMFAVFQLIGLSAPNDLAPVQIAGNSDEPLEEQLAGLQQAREEIGDDNPAAPFIDSQIKARIDETRNPDGSVVLINDEETGRVTYVSTGIALIDKSIEKWRQNPSLMAYKLQANSYKFSWLLIPLSIPFVWLIFAWKRNFGPYDHAVFATYSLSFMSLLFITVTAFSQVPWVPGELLIIAALLIPPLHIYKQLREAYSLRRFSALWRTIVLLVFITFVLTLFLNLLLLLGGLG